MPLVMVMAVTLRAGIWKDLDCDVSGNRICKVDNEMQRSSDIVTRVRLKLQRESGKISDIPLEASTALKNRLLKLVFVIL